MRDVWNVFCYDRMCSLGKEEVSRIVGQKEREFGGGEFVCDCGMLDSRQGTQTDTDRDTGIDTPTPTPT